MRTRDEILRDVIAFIFVAPISRTSGLTQRNASV
jgi:hypothetical protein